MRGRARAGAVVFMTLICVALTFSIAAPSSAQTDEPQRTDAERTDGERRVQPVRADRPGTTKATRPLPGRRKLALASGVWILGLGAVVLVAALKRSDASFTPSGPQPRLGALDGLRGVAVLTVVVYHVFLASFILQGGYGSRAPPAYLWPIASGFLGVDLFFVLSGFLLAQSWWAIRSRYPRLWVAIQEYGLRRLLRIAPAFWVMLIVLVAFRSRWLLASTGGRIELLMFVTFQQFLNPEVPNDINSVTWSLTPEVHFYLVLPLMLLILRKLGWGRALAIALASSLAWRLLVYPTGEVAEWLPGRLDQFMAGMAAASLVAEHHAGVARKVVTYITAGRAWLVPAALLTWTVLQQGSRFGLSQPYWFEIALHPVVGLSLAALIVRAMCLGRTKLLEGRILGFFGLVSYSLYLWHWPFIIESVKRDLSGLGIIVGLAALVGGALVVSVISYRLVEKPALDSKTRLRTWLSRKAAIST